MRTALVLFTCDLRVHDHPALAAAARDAEEVVAVFVLDDAILGGDFARPNRLSYLCDALADLDRSLRRLGTPLVVRRGDVVDQVMAVAGEAHAEAIYLSEDVSAYARRREQRRDDDDLATWKAGRTGIPVVDAGMRQLAREGWMHNRARLVTASFLTKDLYLDWRQGAAHFWDLLVDGDMANNAGNWQWVAGTGNDTRPNRVFNPLRQADRFDPEGDYVRRYVPELAGVEGPAVHRPWKLPESERRALDYPDPMVDHDTAAAEFRHRREGGAPTLF